MSPRRVDSRHALIVALTGASGIAIGLHFLKYVDLLRRHYKYIYTIHTKHAERVAKIEENIELTNYLKTCKVDAVYRGEDLESPIASSSCLINSDMVIVPASLNTIAKIASGIQDNLATRAACNILRLKNRLVIVVRESPLSNIDLRNLYKLSLAGAVILPATIAMYPRLRSIEDFLNFISGKIMDVLGIEHDLYNRWLC